MRKFHQWYRSAVDEQLPLPERAALATADAGGRPSVRYVLVRAYDDSGLVFFTNYDSRKGRDLAENPRAALALYWNPAGRQIRVEGEVEKVDADLSDRYFATRPDGSRAAAIVSPQSATIPDYDSLHLKLERLLAGGDSLDRPQNWGGYRLKPDHFEFWTNKPHRLHERECYRRHQGRWIRELQAP